MPVLNCCTACQNATCYPCGPCAQRCGGGLGPCCVYGCGNSPKSCGFPRTDPYCMHGARGGCAGSFFSCGHGCIGGCIGGVGVSCCGPCCN